MDVKQVLYEKQFQLFKTQDPSMEFFDVCFEIDGKKLYADKFRLAAVSTTFQSMLSERWNSKNEPITITEYSFDDFKEFLSFIYSGECAFTLDNISAMIDIAESYNVEVLKNICEEYLLKMEHSCDSIFKLFEIANKYSMVNLKKTFFAFFVKYFEAVINSEPFLTFGRKSIQDFVTDGKLNPEQVFEAVYKWAEHQAELQKSELNVQKFNLNDAIKNELSELLPHIQFRKMSLNFLHKFVVLKAFIFPTFKELSEILSDVTSENYITRTVAVRATGPKGEILEGTFLRDDTIIKDYHNFQK